MENLELKELQKIEAIKRMKLLKIYPRTIKEFAEENLINKSENGGILYWIDEEEQQFVKEFEEKYNATVYLSRSRQMSAFVLLTCHHLILNYTEFGKLYSLLFVSRYQEEWDNDIDDIQNGRACVYVKNCDENAFSEFGSIGIKPQFGGVARTC